MALSKLDSLYMAVVADHSKHPTTKDKLKMLIRSNSTIQLVEMWIQLSVKFDENDRVEDIAFVNSGCTISTASASMMTDAVMGKQKRKLKNWHRSFSEMVQGQSDPRQEELEMQPSYLESQNSHNGLNVRPSSGMLLKSDRT